MLEKRYPLWLAGKPVDTGLTLEVTDKYTGGKVSEVALADADAIEKAIAAARAAEPAMRRMAAYERRAVLEHCVARFRERFEELALALCVEAGKPIRDARGEVTRLIDTFQVAADEAVRMYGEVIPLDISPRAAGYRGMWKRVPVGACAFITPFNFPLNLVAHKVAPAIAAGCPFVLKPASLTPIGALIIGGVLAEAGLPEGAFSILPCRGPDAAPLVEDDRIKLLSFTGSHDVGWKLKARAGRKNVALELGGNAAVIVERDADVADAVSRIVFGGYYQSGQSCVSVQRVIVHEDVYAELRERLVEAVSALRCGAPRDEDTFIGPVISEAEAERIVSWMESAVAAGARLLTGGTRDGAMVRPAVLEDVPRDQPLWRREVFGPVTVLAPFSDFDEALALANDSDYGLQAGVFTRDVYKLMKAWDELEVGGVMANEVPSWRVDHMPYGGVKRSGTGREGIRFAMEKMTEIRLFVLRTP